MESIEEFTKEAFLLVIERDKNHMQLILNHEDWAEKMGKYDRRLGKLYSRARDLYKEVYEYLCQRSE